MDGNTIPRNDKSTVSSMILDDPIMELTQSNLSISSPWRILSFPNCSSEAISSHWKELIPLFAGWGYVRNRRELGRI